MNTPVPPPSDSDDQGGSVPPPPPPGGAAPPPPPPGFGTQPYGGPPPAGPPQYAGQQYGQPGQPAQPGYGPAPGFEQKPPRPDVKVGAGLIMAGAVIMIIGIYLPWLDEGGETRNGMDLFFTTDGDILDGPGQAVLVFAVILLGLGIALFFAGRVLAVAIIAIVMAAIAELVGLGMVGIANEDVLGGDLGIGVILQAIAPLGALAGSIAATAKRRR